MRSTTVQQLVNFFSASLGGSGEIDLFYGWVESAMTVIREQPWAWNWTKKDLLTYAPVQETGKTFSWTDPLCRILDSSTWLLQASSITISSSLVF